MTVTELVAFRLANYETPLWAAENFVAGRFNSAGSGVTQYLSLHPMTPWAELLRGEERRTAERALMLRYPLWALRVTVAGPVLALSFASAAEHGLSPEELVADDQSACRALAERLRRGGVGAFTAPSAALPGTENLVLLGPRVIAPWQQIPLDTIDLPGAMAAQDGRCPDGLWDLVHHRGAGAEHAALVAWRAGGRYAFTEPVPDRRALTASGLAPGDGET